MGLDSKAQEQIQGLEGGPEWLLGLAARFETLCSKWELAPAGCLPGASSALVSKVKDRKGDILVFKLGFPHFEAQDEGKGLEFWSGDGAVEIFNYDEATGALLLEYCDPGQALSSLPEIEQDTVLCRLLKRLWRKPPQGEFRLLSEMLTFWSTETRKAKSQWVDEAKVELGLELFESLSVGEWETLLVTDLHAGNILASSREAWLMIDPKPFVGDPAYDLTQHLFNCKERMNHYPVETIKRLSELAELSWERVADWTLARLLAESGGPWKNSMEKATKALLLARGY